MRDARSHYAWTDRPVSEETLHTLYERTIAGPTSINTCPARFVFITSEADKARLAKSLKPENVERMQSAPVTAIVAWDPAFWERLDFLFPLEDRKPLFASKDAFKHDTAFRNSTLHGAYFMIAARALRRDVGAMSGFSNEAVDREFFSESGWHSNFLCNLGYADETALFGRLPRFAFDDVCSFAWGADDLTHENGRDAAGESHMPQPFVGAGLSARSELCNRLAHEAWWDQYRPQPTDTALAALLGCTNVIGHQCAAKLGIALAHLAIDAHCTFDRRGVTLSEEVDAPFVAITPEVTADGPASADELAAGAAEVEKYCPFSKLFAAGGTKLQSQWKKT